MSVCFFVAQAHAYQQVRTIELETKIYEFANEESPVLRTAGVGEVLTIGEKTQSGWYRVLVPMGETEAGQKIGWVRSEAIELKSFLRQSGIGQEIETPSSAYGHFSLISFAQFTMGRMHLKTLNDIGGIAQQPAFARGYMLGLGWRPIPEFAFLFHYGEWAFGQSGNEGDGQIFGLELEINFNPGERWQRYIALGYGRYFETELSTANLGPEIATGRFSVGYLDFIGRLRYFPKEFFFVQFQGAYRHSFTRTLYFADKDIKSDLSSLYGGVGLGVLFF